MRTIKQMKQKLVTVLFLSLALGGTFAALSVGDVALARLEKVDRPLPAWIGNTNPDGSDQHFLAWPPTIGLADLEIVARLAPEDAWTPFYTGEGLLDNMAVFPDGGAALYVRRKVVARPCYLGMLGLELVRGAYPSREEYEARPSVLLSEETAKGLFGSAAAALGRKLGNQQGDSVLEYEVAGIYESFSERSYFHGAPDLVLLPDARTMALFDQENGGNAVAASMAFDPARVDPAYVAGTILPALKAARGPAVPLETWRGSSSRDFDPTYMDEYVRDMGASVLRIELFSWLLLLIACLSVMSLALVETTSRTAGIALERALGRSFADLARAAFLRGAALVLACSAGGLLAAKLGLPVLSAALSESIGELYADSAGTVALRPLPAIAAALAAAALAGLVSTLPLFQLRAAPISEALKEGS